MELDKFNSNGFRTRHLICEKIPELLVLKDDKIEYIIELKHKINMITGLSAEGKTELINLISDKKSNITIADYELNMDISRIEVNTSVADLTEICDRQEEYLVILDEQNEVLSSLIKRSGKQLSEADKLLRKEVKNLIKNSNIIYVFILRDLDVCCPLPQDAVLEMITSNNGFTHTAKPVCDIQTFNFDRTSEYVISEDSNGGLDFIREYIKDDKQEIVSCNGIDKLINLLKNYDKSSSIFFDYIGAGHIACNLKEIFDKFPNIYNWYSLEYYILQCLNLVEDADAIINTREIYNKEEAIEFLLKKYIIYNKSKFEKSNACITDRDCIGNIKCPHSGSMRISDKVAECSLATKEKRKKVFSMHRSSEKPQEDSDILYEINEAKEELNDIF